MARIATLLGKDVKSGSWSSLGVAEGGDGLNELVEKYKQIRSAEGAIKRGKSEVRFSEVRLLATATAGGEMKAKLRFK